MMAMISPALEAFVESLSTLKFANRAKNIKNEARINEDLDQKSLLRRYERELKRLRAELEERSRNVVDQRRLLEMDEQRRRAEEDKMAAIRALEARSKEFMREKQEKKRLEERITMLQSQVIMGGADKTNIGNWQEVPAFRNALKEHQERIRAEYDSRLAELEKERETIEEEKAQVDRYKQLLLKQRDIMILLTQRLNERDEQIMALQDELDAYDRHQRELEEKLDEKTAALILFNVDGGINISMAIRSAALFGFSDVYIVGRRKRDKRGDVGACNYIKVHQIETINDKYFEENKLIPIVVEQNGQSLEEFDFRPYFPKSTGSNDTFKVAFIVGSEQEGVNIKLNGPIITISQYGVMRSFNVAMASSIVMYEYTRQWRKLILKDII
jgi:tRNA G18 (ribose-2'-O)-methylase SpoU